MKKNKKVLERAMKQYADARSDVQQAIDRFYWASDVLRMAGAEHHDAPAEVIDLANKHSASHRPDWGKIQSRAHEELIATAMGDFGRWPFAVQFSDANLRKLADKVADIMVASGKSEATTEDVLDEIQMALSADSLPKEWENNVTLKRLGIGYIEMTVKEKP